MCLLAPIQARSQGKRNILGPAPIMIERPEGGIVMLFFLK